MLPTGFEPVSKPREGFMIGRYTTGATRLGMDRFLINLSIVKNQSNPDFDSFWSEIARTYRRKPLVLHGFDLPSDLGDLLPAQPGVSGDLRI